MSYRLAIAKAIFVGSTVFAAGASTAANIDTGLLSDSETGAKSGAICDGVGDDTSDLQALLDAGKDLVNNLYDYTVVTIPVTPTGCRIAAPLRVYSNTRIVQDGLLKLVGFTAPTPVEQWGMYTIMDDSQNVVIEGNGTLDGNRAAYTSGMCCMGGIVAGGPEVGDYNANVKNITIRGLRIVNSSMWPVSIDNAENVKIDAVTADNSVSTFQIAHNSTNVSVNNIHVSNADDVGFSFYRGVHNASLTNSVVHDTAGSAISVFTDSPSGVPAGQPSFDITIVGNVAYEGVAGIDVSGTDSTSSRNVNISGNTVHHNDIAGIIVAPCTNCQITGNLIHDDGAGSGNVPGVWIVNSPGLNIVGNTIFNEGQGGTSGFGIIVNDFISGAPASSRLTITGNKIYDDQSTQTMAHSFGGAISVPASVTSNTLGATIGTRDNFVYASGSAVSNINMP